MPAKTDRIFARALNELVDFRFDQQTVDVFADMINRSVPAYGSLIRLLSTLSCYVQKDSKVYDLGCSLGAASLSLLNGMAHQQLKVVAVDNSAEMIAELQKILQRHQLQHLFECYHQDIQHTQIDNASLVMMNLTLQFIKPELRDNLIERIYQGLNKGGALLLTEKVVQPDLAVETELQKLHEQFKRENGYSELEISQKRQALENVLIREPVADHIKRLQKAGFSKIIPWFQAFQFVSLLAIK